MKKEIYSRAAKDLYEAINAEGADGFNTCSGSCYYTPCLCRAALHAIELLKGVADDEGRA